MRGGVSVVNLLDVASMQFNLNMKPTTVCDRKRESEKLMDLFNASNGERQPGESGRRAGVMRNSSR
jgi:hypothetical protein